MTNISRPAVRGAVLLLTVAACSGADSAGSGNVTASAASAPGNTAYYEITIPEDDHRVALVTGSLVPDGDSFYMFPGADQLPMRWATFVSDFQVHDRNDKPIHVIARDDGSFRLSSTPDGLVTFNYRVSLDHEQHDWNGGIDGAAYWREWGVFYTARSLFIVNGKERKNITVDFRLPDQWRVTAPWPNGDGGTNRFVIPGHDVLGTSMFFAGTHKEVLVRQGSFEFLLALGGDDVLALENDFVDMARGILDYYVDLMGDVPRLRGDTAAGKPVVIINQAGMTDGEAVGNNISILLEPSGDPMAQHIVRLIFAHEFFHLWNGKSFIPGGEDSEWFKEGFSNYYTLKALHQIGYLTDESFLDLLAGFFYQRYVGDDAVGRQPLTRGDLKHDHWGLIYSGGMLVAIAQDMQIRAATGNERSLDDLMRLMFNEYGSNTYDVGDIERALSDLNNASQEDFFDRYVYGTEKMDIARFLALADIETAEQDGRTVFRPRKDPDPDKARIQRGLFRN